MICEKCGKVPPAEDANYSAYLCGDESYEELCYSCALELYKEGWEITDNYSDEVVYACSDCGEFYTEGELKVVDNGDFLCEYCLEGDLSRGEHVTVHYGDVDFSELKRKANYLPASAKEVAEAICGELNFGHIGWDEDTGIIDVYANKEVAIKNTEKFLIKKFGGFR